jgi:hypothetical protein
VLKKPEHQSIENGILMHKKTGKPPNLFLTQTRRRLPEKFINIFLLGAENTI